MIMTWQPQEEGLRQIIQLLKESQSPDTVIQRTVQQVSFFRNSNNQYWLETHRLTMLLLKKFIESRIIKSPNLVWPPKC